MNFFLDKETKYSYFSIRSFIERNCLWVLTNNSSEAKRYVFNKHEVSSEQARWRLAIKR
jgi:hypothetical protein